MSVKITSKDFSSVVMIIMLIPQQSLTSYDSFHIVQNIFSLIILEMRKNLIIETDDGKGKP